MDKLENIIADIEKELNESKKMFGKNLVDKEKLISLVDLWKASLPGAIAKANQILAEADDIRYKAKEEYQRTVSQAEERAAFLVDNDNIVYEAEKRAAKILKSAEYQGQQVGYDAKLRIDNLLSMTEKALLDQINLVRNNREALRGELIKQETVINNVSSMSPEELQKSKDATPIIEAPVATPSSQPRKRGSINDPSNPLYMPKS